jgi:hypothetical protein
MATPEERLSTLEARFDSLMEILENQLTNMNERFDGVCRRLDNIHLAFPIYAFGVCSCSFLVHPL